jgi:hypothetical protein
MVSSALQIFPVVIVQLHDLSLVWSWSSIARLMSRVSAGHKELEGTVLMTRRRSSTDARVTR